MASPTVPPQSSGQSIEAGSQLIGTQCIGPCNPPDVTGKGWHGQVKLGWQRQGDRTAPVETRTAAPLRLQRPFYPEGNAVCHSTVIHTAGGMVGGDRLDLEFDLGPRGQALVTTAAANKIYRSSGAIAAQNIALTLAAETSLEWFPQETIVFNGAQFQQRLRVNLAPGAVWLGWEVTRFGRSARGERFMTGQWRSHTEVWQASRPLWIDRQHLVGGSPALDSPHGLAYQPVIASFAILGIQADADWIAQARELAVSDINGAEVNGDAVGVTALTKGLLCRYRGLSSQSARRWFIRVWQMIRPALLGRPACLPRVWSR